MTIHAAKGILPVEKVLTLCADDFSLNAAINQGIVRLLEQGRLSAVSCMAQSPSWVSDSKLLLPWKQRADIGVHINFTHGFTDNYRLPLPVLMLRAQLRCLSHAKLRDSLCQQLDAFEDALGMEPDFIDGHQHVHIFPVIRDVLLSEYQRRYGQRKPYVRSLHCLPASDGGLKVRVLNLMGAAKLQRQLVARSIPHNRAFAGLYSLRPDENYDQRMQAWLANLPAGSLIMCHPAAYLAHDDDHPKARVVEYEYLLGDRCAQAMSASGVGWSRLQNAVCG